MVSGVGCPSRSSISQWNSPYHAPDYDRGNAVSIEIFRSEYPVKKIISRIDGYAACDGKRDVDVELAEDGARLHGLFRNGTLNVSPVKEPERCAHYQQRNSGGKPYGGVRNDRTARDTFQYELDEHHDAGCGHHEGYECDDVEVKAAHSANAGILVGLLRVRRGAASPDDDAVDYQPYDDNRNERSEDTEDQKKGVRHG